MFLKVLNKVSACKHVASTPALTKWLLCSNSALAPTAVLPAWLLALTLYVRMCVLYVCACPPPPPPSCLTPTVLTQKCQFCNFHSVFGHFAQIIPPPPPPPVDHTLWETLSVDTHYTHFSANYSHLGKKGQNWQIFFLQFQKFLHHSSYSSHLVICMSFW